MTRLKKIVSTLLATMMCLSMLTACTKANCKASSVIAIIDARGNPRSSFAPGETVTLELNIKVTSDDDGVTPVKAVLTIPKVKNVEAKYANGQEITSKYDSDKDVTTYELTANASKNAEMLEAEIKFSPSTTGSINMELVYDGHVDSSYDVSRTMNFAEAYIDEGIDDIISDTL